MVGEAVVEATAAGEALGVAAGATARSTAGAGAAGATVGTAARTTAGVEPYPDFYFQLSKTQRKNWRIRHRQHKR